MSLSRLEYVIQCVYHGWNLLYNEFITAEDSPHIPIHRITNYMLIIIAKRWWSWWCQCVVIRPQPRQDGCG